MMCSFWPTKPQVTGALIASFSAALTLALGWSLNFKAAPAPPRPSVKVAVRMEVRPPQVPSVEPAVDSPTAKLPLHVETLEPTPAAPVKKAVPVEVRPPADAPSTDAVAMPSSALVQPSATTPLQSPSGNSGFPQIGGAAPSPVADAPPSPSDIPPFTSALAAFEPPGESVTVVAVLLDETGTAVDAMLVVPSKWPLVDLTLVFSQKGKQWLDLDPPMLPGEFRWIELRIDSAVSRTRSNTLP